ncbi:hypothetical protein EMCG_09185 [[Emmonsia] crescens]|uniref:Uncharacterized protein n=1 Tax=[Emmonsia] crescens TaxID=73230 RepID=A0A0G2J3E2_9EURO|nr:hypothetical protein EMCG_09185 [Emmonsia crescens UAMH 3008]
MVFPRSSSTIPTCPYRCCSLLRSRVRIIRQTKEELVPRPQFRATRCAHDAADTVQQVSAGIPAHRKTSAFVTDALHDSRGR